MLKGDINRMMITNDKDESLKMYAFAHERLSRVGDEEDLLETQTCYH